MSKLFITPPPQQQLNFLRQLQRILSDGGFVASYKYALLHALADLCVLKGEDTGAELSLRTSEISEQIIELYWRQAGAFQAPNTPDPVVLRQNTGKQAAIVSYIAQEQARFESLARIQCNRSEWIRLVKRVDNTVRTMPLWRLQTVGPDRLNFLYENRDDFRVRVITLKPGVAYCFRTFYDLIIDLVRGAWLRFVRSNNALVLGETGDLSAFLFGSERGTLSVYRPVLMEVQKGNCFYCGKALGSNVDVDHFIPWARYPVDLGHNFVLTHDRCNRSKSDYLAAPPHLERWLQRNQEHESVLRAWFQQAGVSNDVHASTQIARWAYTQTDRLGASVWLSGRTVIPLSSEWTSLFPG